jgi:hypothetical protein
MLVYRFAELCESSDMEDFWSEEILGFELATSLEAWSENIL